MQTSTERSRTTSHDEATDDQFYAKLRVYELTLGQVRHEDLRRGLLLASFTVSNALVGGIVVSVGIEPGSSAYYALCAAGLILNLLWGTLFAHSEIQIRRFNHMTRILQEDLVMERAWRVVSDDDATPDERWPHGTHNLERLLGWVRIGPVLATMVTMAAALWAAPLVIAVLRA